MAVCAGASVTAIWRVQHTTASWRNVEVITTNLLGDPTVEGIVLTMRDVTERKGLEEELKHQAFHDALSGLANRALFRDRLEHALRAGRALENVARRALLGPRRLQARQRQLGHAAGDEPVGLVADRIARCLREGDTAARFGGDEFAVLLEEIDGPGEAFEVADRLSSSCPCRPVVDDHEIVPKASIGIALSPAGAEDPAELLQAADVAMYAAKARGKGCYEVYRPALQEAVVERLSETADLHRAVEHERVRLALPAHHEPRRHARGGPRGAGALAAPRARAPAPRSTSSRSPRRRG